MRCPKPHTRKPANFQPLILDWLRHFGAESAGPIALYLILPTLMFVAVLLFGCLFNDAPIIPLCMVGVLLSVFVPLIFVRCYRVLRRTVQADRASGLISDTSNTLILELSGSFTPYVIEAAEKLGDSHEPSVAPALLLVLEQAVAEQRAGWEDIAGALIKALGNLGDHRALPVLESLRAVKGVCNLPSLLMAIEQIGVAQFHAQLLRPVDHDPATRSTLLRPVAEQHADGGASLLRAVER